jgi:transposase-like protein
MAQHYLLRPEARSLDIERILGMSEEDAHEQFKLLRWPATGGRPVCPARGCGCDAVYETVRVCPSRSKTPGKKPSIRRLWKCKRCYRQFSVTSGTPFASHKLPFSKLLALGALFVDKPKGITAIEISHRARCHYTTAFVAGQKMREVMNSVQLANELTGAVEIDATFTGGHHRKANLVKNRRNPTDVDRSRQKCVTIVRERRPGGKSVALVTKRDREAVPFIIDKVKASRIYADEAPAYNSLHAFFELRRINHSKVGLAVDDRSTNWAESFFSRFKRAVKGTYHHVSGPYTQHYANEISWREDHRRVSSKDQHQELMSSVLSQPVSRAMKGYWQRKKAA